MSSLRVRTDIRFAILVAAVLASSVVALSVIHVASPALARVSREVVDPCLAGIDSAVRPLQLSATDSALLKGRLANRCMEPFFAHQVRWVGLGLLAQVLLAALLYGLHPWWLTRRRKLTRLAGAGNADVLAELDDLARQAGLARPPGWLLAPYASTHGGQAFGLPGRRRVCLDVGLLVRYDTDRAGFRAVVRHELGHLHNRDVDRTYLTIALWWSFLATAVSPFIALSLNPDLLRRPQRLSWSGVTGSWGELVYRLVALLALTVVVYLARNAILRTREVHADVVAATWDAPDGALPRVLGALPWPPRAGRWPVPRGWRRYGARLGTHPDPAHRVAAMGDPGRLARPGGWDLAGLGLVTGLALNNISLFAGNLMGAFLLTGLVLLALPAGMLLVGALVSALRRADAAGSDPRQARRNAVLLPVAVAAGFAASGPLSLLAADTNLPGFTAGPVALNTALLIVGALLIAAWARSVDRFLADRSGGGAPPRLHSAAVTVVAVLVGGTLFALGYSYSFGTGLFSTFNGAGWPLTGWTIGWYTALAKVVGGLYLYLPLLKTMQTPVASLGLVLLWAVPAVALLGGHRDSPRSTGLRRALTVGAVAGVAAIVIGIALPYAARELLPADVRRTPANLDGESLLFFRWVYSHTYIVAAAVLQAVAAAVVAAASTRLRPVLVPLAVTVTAVLGTAGLYASWAVSSCIGLVPSSPTSCGLAVLLPDAYTTVHLHTTLVWGIAAAIPAALLGAGIGALWRRRRPSPAAGHPPVQHGRRWLTAGVLGVSGALVVAGAAAGVPGMVQTWTPSPTPAVTVAPQQPGPTAGPPAIDPCVVGTWREESHVVETPVGAQRVSFTSSGATQTFRPDGVVTVDTGTGVTATATIDGHRVEIVTTGSVSARYRTANGIISYADATVVRAGTVTITVDGAPKGSDPLTAEVSDDRYTCVGADTIRLTPADASAGGPHAITLKRR